MRPPPAASHTRLALLLPLVMLCMALVAASLVCASRVPLHAGLAWALHTAPLAAGATLACLALALAPAAQATGPLWVLPLWLAPVLGGVGWAVLPHNATLLVARTALLVVPLMMALLAMAWSRLPAGVLLGAASCGAPPWVRVWLFGRLRGPGVGWACLPVFFVCLAVIG